METMTAAEESRRLHTWIAENRGEPNPDKNVLREDDLTEHQVCAIHKFGERWITPYDRRDRKHWERSLRLWTALPQVILSSDQHNVPKGKIDATAANEYNLHQGEQNVIAALRSRAPTDTGAKMNEPAPQKLHTVDCWAYGPAEASTISEALADNRVIKVTPIADGKFQVLEKCDDFYGATLTAEQLAEWGRELIALATAPAK